MLNSLGRATVVLTVLALPLVAGATGADADGDHRHDRGNHELDQVREATDKYHSIQKAERDGYARPESGPLHYCIDEDLDTKDKNRLPAMGFHWVKGSLVDGKVDAEHPEAMVYAPTRTGRLRLVAVEYVVPEAAWGKPKDKKPPRLFGQDFLHVAEPNRYKIPAFYALHAWVWKHNPDGTFASMNPRVSCVYAHLNQ
jgi:hypothetical protein